MAIPEGGLIRGQGGHDGVFRPHLYYPAAMSDDRRTIFAMVNFMHSDTVYANVDARHVRSANGSDAFADIYGT